MQSLAKIVKSYYTEMGNKNVENLEQYLHHDVEFIGPMAEMAGKEHVLNAAENFMNMFDSIEIRQVFENDNNSAMIVFDLICPAPIGRFKAATLMIIEHDLITKMELFYDARPFEKKKDEIFTTNSQ